MPKRSYKANEPVGSEQERCIYCSGTKLTKKGTRKKKFETVQLWYCKDCDAVFTPRALKGKTYPIPVILDGLSHYHTGHSVETSAMLIRERYGASVTPTTLSRWLEEYKALCPYRTLRDEGKELYPPSRIIRSTRFHHQQVYHYRLHQGKIELAFRHERHQALSPLQTFLKAMTTDCPHRYFQKEREGRASKLKVYFDRDGISIRERQNLAIRMAHLSVQSARHNRQRHDVVQNFMIANDAVTVAAEVPVYLFPKDIRHFKSELGFDLPYDDNQTMTGHIDALQVRGGSIHVLDYKPNARREKPIEQLTFYALALSRRTGLRLFDFTCAWFDDKHYFEFFPLQVVSKKKRSLSRRY
jgi:hypothetical protein